MGTYFPHTHPKGQQGGIFLILSTFFKAKKLTQLKSKMPICLKRKIYNQCVIPAMTYGCETWKLTKQAKNSLRIAQRAMERAMLGITLRDTKRSTWIREKSNVKDIIQVVKQQKWRWARMNDNRW